MIAAPFAEGFESSKSPSYEWRRNYQEETHPLPHGEIHRKALEELQATHRLELRHVRCIASDRCLLVTGSVPTFFLKQVVQETLQKRFGSSYRIVNQLEVTTFNDSDRDEFET